MITEDLDTVIKALKEAESEIYELDADAKNIRRKTEVVQQDHVNRSIYIKGLPKVDVDAKDPVAELFVLQDKIDELFSQHGKVLCVRLKKTADRQKQFKGSAYIEFSTPEEAKKVAELKEIELDGQKLEILYKPTYHELKSAEYKDSPIRKKNYSFNAFKPQQQHINNKRKSNGGFANNGNKKVKTDEEPKPAATEESKEEPKEEPKEESKEESKEE